MGCGCGGRVQVRFEVRLSDGTVKSFGSRRQAEAWLARKGGDGKIVKQGTAS